MCILFKWERICGDVYEGRIKKRERIFFLFYKGEGKGRCYFLFMKIKIIIF